MTDPTLCPLCEQGTLQEYNEPIEVEYRGRTTKLPSFYSVCDCCKAEQATPQQTKNNKRRMIAFKKQVDGLLSGEQVRELRSQFNLTQAQAAKIFGGGPVAFSKYESDDVMQSESMDNLLRIARDVPEAYFYLAGRAGIEPASCESQWIEISSASVSTGDAGVRLIHSNTWEQTDTPRYA